MQQDAPRNIMDEILYGKEQETTVSAVTAKSQLFYLFGEPNKKKKRGGTRRASSIHKKKGTHYLTPRTREKLDKLRAQLLQLYPDIDKNTFSRSNIVDKTLESVTKKFHQGEDRQELLRMLLSGKQFDLNKKPFCSDATSPA